MSSPAEVAHEAAAFLIQETLPAVRRLHPALARGPPVLPKERHGTERGRDGRTGRIDSQEPAWLAQGMGRAGMMLENAGGDRYKSRGTGVEGCGSWVDAGSPCTHRGSGAGEGRVSRPDSGNAAWLPERSIYPGPLPRLFVAGRAACS